MAARIGGRATLVGIALAMLALMLALLALAARPGLTTAKAGGCDGLGDAAPQSLSNGEARDTILCLINNERRQRALPALDRDKKLQKAAQRHTDRMHGTGCFAHECPGEAGLQARLANVDYLGRGVERWAFAENIAWGMRDHGTPRAIVDAWMSSDGHRASILSSSFRDLGVGFAAGTPQRKRGNGGIYTADFGLAVR